jgi:hypothetical protein
MATADQIATLRLYVSEPDQATWTDEMLSSIIDSSTSLNTAAVEVWDSKAAALATLVDISEGGSSRKNSDLVKNALLMRDLFYNKEQTSLALTQGTRIRRLMR